MLQDSGAAEAQQAQHLLCFHLKTASQDMSCYTDGQTGGGLHTFYPTHQRKGRQCPG